MVWFMAQKLLAGLVVLTGTNAMLPVNLLESGVPKSREPSLFPEPDERGKEIPTKADAAFPCEARL